VLCDCVPSKTFIASTGLRTELRRATRLGFDAHVGDVKICLAEIHQRIKTLAMEQSMDITAQLLSMGVELIAGRSELVDAAPGLARHRVKVMARGRQHHDPRCRRGLDRHRRLGRRGLPTNLRSADHAVRAMTPEVIAATCDTPNTN
jgi:hypothetical protein